jgi:hypothetical protein
MKTLPKILTTFAIIGFVFLIFAAALQGYNRPLADKFGYTGLAFLAFNVFIVGVSAIAAIWSNRFKSYILSLI